jgi:hypothetical protein
MHYVSGGDRRYPVHEARRWDYSVLVGMCACMHAYGARTRGSRHRHKIGVLPCFVVSYYKIELIIPKIHQRPQHIINNNIVGM